MQIDKLNKQHEHTKCVSNENNVCFAKKAGEQNRRGSRVCPPALLSCSSYFLSALQQNRAQLRLLYLCYDKNSVKSPRITFKCSKQTIGRWRDSFSSGFYSLVKHTFSTNQGALHLNVIITLFKVLFKCLLLKAF